MGKTVKIDNKADVKIIEADNLQQKGKQASPFTTKNIVILIFLFIVSIALIAVTIVFVMGINFPKLFETIANGFAFKTGIVWFVLLIFILFYCIFMNYATLWVRIRKWGFKIPQWEYWIFAAAVSFLRAVTPVVFSDPYTLFWLKTKGIPTSKCTSLLFSNTWFWLLSHFIVSFIPFVMVMVYRGKILGDPQGISTFIFMCAGVAIDFFNIAIMSILCFWKQAHYTLSSIFNWVKKKLHMKYHTKAQIAAKYKNRATIKNDVIRFLKDWKTTAWVFVIFIINEIMFYFAIAISMYFVQYVTYAPNEVYKVGFSFGWAFTCACMAMKANRLNFIAPGGEGTIEFFFYNLLLKFSNWNISPVPPSQEIWNALTQNVTWNSILVWRTFTNFAPAFIGMGCMVGLTAKQIVNYNRKRKTR